MKLLFSITTKPLLVLLLILMITTGAIILIAQNAHLETDLDEYMPSTHPLFVQSKENSEIFGITDAIMIAIEHPTSIYNPGTLEKIKQISIELPTHFDVLTDAQVSSLYTASNIKGGDWGLEVIPFYEDVPTSEKELETLKNDVRSNEMIFTRIVSEDETSTLIMFEIAENTDTTQLQKELHTYVSQYEGPETLYVAGRAIVEGALAELGPADMLTMFPLVVIIMTILLLVLLRSVRHTILNLIIVLIGTVAAFGSMSLLGIPIYAVDTMIPVMLIAIGVAYGIHMHNSITQIIKNDPTVTKDKLIHLTLSRMVRPVSMAAVTTAIGFSALMTSQVLPVRYFGLFSAIGVLTEMLLSLLLFPISIRVLGIPKVKRHQDIEESMGTLKKNLFASLVLHKQKPIVIGSLLLAIIGIYGATQIWIDTSFLANFEEDHPIAITDKFVNTTFGGTSSVNLILSSDHPDTFKNPKVLQTMEEMQQHIKTNPLVGASFSLTDFIKRMNFVMNDEEDSFLSIPDNQELIAQYLLLYDMSGDTETLSKVVDYNFEKTNIQIQLKNDSSLLMEEIILSVDAYADEFKELGIAISYSGSGYTAFIFSSLLMDGQILSLAISFIIVAILLALVFKNLLIGIIGTIPIAITATVNFGVMGLLGIPLSSATALISSIAIGIGVDYAIHLIEHYISKRKEGLSIKETVNETVIHTGKAIVFNALAVMGGFIVLTFSVFPPNRQVGALIALNMVISATMTLTVLLVTIIAIDKRKKINFTTK
jgi:predicted RND superfamily exporter protein